MAADATFAFLHGLTRRADLNGRRVRVLEQSKERWAVQLEHCIAKEENLRVQPANLHIVEPMLKVGACTLPSPLLAHPSYGKYLELSQLQHQCGAPELIACMQALRSEPPGPDVIAATIACVVNLSKVVHAKDIDTILDDELLHIRVEAEIDALVREDAVEILMRVLSAHIVSRTVRMYGTLILHSLWRLSALARDRGEAADGLETISFLIRAEHNDLVVVSNAINALISLVGLADSKGDGVARAVRQENSFYQRTVSSFLPDGDSLLSLLVRSMRDIRARPDHLEKTESDRERARKLKEKVLSLTLKFITTGMPWVAANGVPLYQSACDCELIVLVCELISEHRDEPDFEPDGDRGTIKLWGTTCLQAMMSGVLSSERVEVPDDLKRRLHTQAHEAAVRLDLPIPFLQAQAAPATRRKVVFGASPAAEPAPVADGKTASSASGSTRRGALDGASGPPSAILVGLKQRATLNGVEVDVDSYNRTKRRYAVRTRATEHVVESGLLVRRENLQPAGEADQPTARLALDEHLTKLRNLEVRAAIDYNTDETLEKLVSRTQGPQIAPPLGIAMPSVIGLRLLFARSHRDAIDALTAR